MVNSLCCCYFVHSYPIFQVKQVLHPVSKSTYNKLHNNWVSNQLFKQTIHLVENKEHKRIHINECKCDILTLSLSTIMDPGLS